MGVCWTRPPHDGELLAQKRRAATAKGLDVLPALRCRRTFSVARPLAQRASENTTTDVQGAMATCSAQPRPYVVREALEALGCPNRL